MAEQVISQETHYQVQKYNPGLLSWSDTGPQIGPDDKFARHVLARYCQDYSKNQYRLVKVTTTVTLVEGET